MQTFLAQIKQLAAAEALPLSSWLSFGSEPCWIVRRSVICVMMLTYILFAGSLSNAADITLSETCSLANAIRSANGDTQVAPADACAAGDTTETDTIIFETHVEITQALPAIT